MYVEDGLRLNTLRNATSFVLASFKMFRTISINILETVGNMTVVQPSCNILVSINAAVGVR